MLPHIRGMMYVPLNAVIVTEVYKSSLQSPEKFIPTTMTELYTALTQSLLLRYLHSHSEYGQQQWKLQDFTDLPQELFEQFCHICKVALSGMIEDKFVFEDLPNDFNTLDLMQSVPELYVQHGAVVSYNFFHLTLQEYLAAVEISKLPVKKQIDFFEGDLGCDGLTDTDLIVPDQVWKCPVLIENLSTWTLNDNEYGHLPPEQSHTCSLAPPSVIFTHNHHETPDINISSSDYDDYEEDQETV